MELFLLGLIVGGASVYLFLYVRAWKRHIYDEYQKLKAEETYDLFRNRVRNRAPRGQSRNQDHS
jgi:hypothetical protein